MKTVLTILICLVAVSAMADTGVFVVGKDSRLFHRKVSTDCGVTYGRFQSRNFGTDPVLENIGYNASGTPDYGEIRYIAYYDLSSIPTNATVNSVICSVYVTGKASGTADNDSIRRLWRDWDEGTGNNDCGTCSWDSAATDVVWTTEGGDFYSTYYGHKDFGSASGWHTISSASFQNLVEFWVANPDSNFGFVTVCNSSGGTRANIASDDNATSSRHSRIYVDWTTADSDPPEPDPAEFSVAPDDASTTSIDMTGKYSTDDDPDVYYSFVASSITGGGGATSSGWQSAWDSTYTDTGLDKNEQYSYTVQTKDGEGNTGTASSPESCYTAAAVPGTLSCTATSSTVTFSTLDANGNPSSTPTTLFAVYDTVGSQWIDTVTSVSEAEYKMPIVFPDTNAVALDSFPLYVLIEETDSDFWDEADTDGGNVLFKDKNGDILYHSFERFDHTNDTCEAWVRVDISAGGGGSTDTIYVHYGGVSGTEDPTNTWNDDYKAVYHFTGSDSLLDETTNDNDLTDSGTVPYDADGKSGGCFDFDGSTDDFDAGNDASIKISGNMTVSFWLNPDEIHAAWDFYCGKTSDGSWNTGWGFFSNNNNFITFYTSAYNDAGAVQCSLYDTGNWQHFVGVHNTGDANENKIYRNGVLIDTGSDDAWSDDASETMSLGSSGSDSYNLNGKMDEFRISDVVRSSSWIFAEYKNLVDPTNFCAVGAEETVDAGGDTTWASTDTVWASETKWETIVLNSLDTDSTLCLKVIAENGDSDPTAFGDVACVTTSDAVTIDLDMRLRHNRYFDGTQRGISDRFPPE